MISSYALNKIRHQFFFSNSINYLVRFLIALFATLEDSYLYTYSFSHAETLLYILVYTDSLIIRLELNLNLLKINDITIKLKSILVIVSAMRKPFGILT